MIGSTLAGILVAFAAMFLGLLAYFLRTWWQRRAEREYLLIALLSGALAGYSAGLATFYLGVSREDWLSWWYLSSRVTTCSAIVSTALLVHFAIRYARLSVERIVMSIIYGVAMFFEVAVMVGGWWRGAPTSIGETSIFGLVFPVAVHVISPIAQTFYASVVVATSSSAALIGRAYLAGRTEGLPAFLGAVALAIFAANDAMLGIGRVGVYLAPFGFVLFAFGVGLTLVGRFVNTSRDLEQRGDELRRKSRELRRSYKELQLAQAELVRKEQLAVIGELAAVVAHEVRNPLAVISNAVAGLRKEGLNPDDRRTLLDIVDEEATRINRLVGDLLRYSRPVSPQRASLPLAELLERSLGLVSRDERSGDVKVVFQVDDAAPAVWGDGSLLRQVFDNLVGNAVQAMSSGGTLTVGIQGLTMDGLEGVAVTISDTGEGMDTMVRNRARTPFFTTRPSGTGLGLAIVDRIIDAHGGTMTLDSRSGEGTTVSVFLPVGTENGPPPVPRSRMDSTASFLPPRGGSNAE